MNLYKIMFVLGIYLLSQGAWAQQSCHNNLSCPAGQICNTKKQCESKPGANCGYGGCPGGGTSGGDGGGTPLEGSDVANAGIDCLMGLKSKCGFPDEMTYKDLLNKSTAACAQKIGLTPPIDPSKINPSVKANINNCVFAAVKKFLENFYGVQWGVCLPFVDKIKTCIDFSVTLMGYGFERLWCEMYPDDPFCSGGKDWKQQARNALFKCTGETQPSDVAGCYNCCMKQSGYRNCNNLLPGTADVDRCKAWDEVCSDCYRRPRK